MEPSQCSHPQLALFSDDAYRRPTRLLFSVASPEDVAFAIGISAGTFLAIATADILPQVHRIEQRNPATLVFLVAGLSVSWLGKFIAS
jgi:zinc transporter ZupT